MQPAPVSLPGESHGQRSLAGSSPRGRKESDRPERVSKSSQAKTSKSDMGETRKHDSFRGKIPLQL